MRKALLSVAFAAAAAIGGLTACGGSSSDARSASTSSQPETFAMYGYALLKPTATDILDVIHNGTADCHGRDQYSDVKDGAQVVVTDSSGKTVGLGTLTNSGYFKSTQAGTPDKGCQFDFVVNGLPADSPFFGITIAQHGPVQATQLDAATPNGVTVTFG